MHTDLENQGGKVKPRIVAGTYEERKGKCRQNPEGLQAWVSCSSGRRDLGACVRVRVTLGLGKHRADTPQKHSRK